MYILALRPRHLGFGVSNSSRDQQFLARELHSRTALPPELILEARRLEGIQLCEFLAANSQGQEVLCAESIRVERYDSNELLKWKERCN